MAFHTPLEPDDPFAFRSIKDVLAGAVIRRTD